MGLSRLPASGLQAGALRSDHTNILRMCGSKHSEILRKDDAPGIGSIRIARLGRWEARPEVNLA